MTFRERNRIKREKQNAWAVRGEDYMNSLREERQIAKERKTERDYFLAGQHPRRKYKPSKASARTQAYYGYYFETLNID